MSCNDEYYDKIYKCADHMERITDELRILKIVVKNS